jgi:hypothetical protein
MVAWTQDMEELLIKMFLDNRSYPEMAAEFDVSIDALRSRIYRMRKRGKIPMSERRHTRAVKSNLPVASEVFLYVKDKPRTLVELCNRFGLSPKVMRAFLDEMREDGYLVVTTTQDRTVIPTATKPGGVPMGKTLADTGSVVVPVGIISDIHGGSAYSQPSVVKSLAHIMAEEYGVRHFLQPGDSTDGIWMFSGHDNVLIPPARALNSRHAPTAVRMQAQLADIYTPNLGGDCEWFILGGNHDWSCIKKAGIDPIRILCDGRDDLHYMGYDVGGVWLTDRVYLRMWHPTGGVPYAKSYRLQKGLESQAVEALQAAISREECPATSVLVAGHLHITIWMPEMPIAGLHPGCCQGQTPYLKAKGYMPAIGGVVLRFLIGDDGRVKRIEHTWLPYDEIEDDWKHFPVPELPEMDTSAEIIPGSLYTIEAGKTIDDFVILDPRGGVKEQTSDTEK